MRLKDKRIVITGAGSGIGRATAQKCAAEGARVVCADLHAESAEETVRLIRDAGGEPSGHFPSQAIIAPERTSISDYEGLFIHQRFTS